MSINTAIYNQLAEDENLKTLLAPSKINPLKPAIYEFWAVGNDMPYMNLSFSTSEADHWGKRITSLNIDIFAHQDTVLAEAIKNRVIKILDRQKIELEGGHFARCHSNTDALIAEPINELITHWNINFSVLYWRKNWILDNEGTEAE